MKRKVIYLLAMVLMAGSTALFAQQPVKKGISAAVPKDSTGYIVKVGDKAPAFSITLTNGKKLLPKDFKGKVVLLQFTASWCGVCRKEMPHLENDIWQKYKNNPNFVFIGVDRDEPVETVLKFAEQTGVTYPLGLDPAGKIFTLFAESKAGITRNVLIDKNGHIIYLTRLFNEEEYNGLLKHVDKALSKK
jgi:peroxiredoxin